MLELRVPVLSLPDLAQHVLCPAEDLDLELCLASGQTFSWERHFGQYWMNVLQGHLAILTTNERFVCFLAAPKDAAVIRALLVAYFRLDHDLRALYRQWSAADGLFSSTATKYQAIRLLAQDPFESLLSFLCSQNNGIGRITKMVRHLKERYGSHAGSLGSSDGEHVVRLHSFPTAPQLVDAHVKESDLRAAGFGYRAAYLVQAANAVASGRLDLDALGATALGYEQAWNELMKLSGVGPKVADCVALTGLGHMEAFPIDTHMWQLACRHYGKRLPGAGGSGQRSAATATLTPKTYPLVGAFFRRVFGAEAGWAHLVLFAAKIRASASAATQRGRRPLAG